MAIKKSELYSSLWQSCDELRGGMDASQYKDYILVLLFVKYVSDKHAGKADAVIEIPKGGSFRDMVAWKGKKEIGDEMNKVIARLAKANDLAGVIDVADFNDGDKLGKGKEMVDRLSNLLDIFNSPDLDFSKNRADGDDLLGDAYEYLMRHFATESGKSKGQFYTPAEVSRIIAKVVGAGEAKSSKQTIYDPTCGSGSLLLKAHDEAKHASGVDVSLYGQEMDNATAALAKMNMILHDCPTAEIWKDNTIANPHFKEKDGKLKTFDFAVANPPFSTKAWSSGIDAPNDLYNRFEYGIPPDKNGDYAFLLHVLASLKSTGKGAVILPHGVLFRGNVEAEIRRNLLQRGFIQGIIGLPANLFYGTGIPACIVILDKENAAGRKGVFLIDASKGFVKDGNKNRLRDQDIHRIVDTFAKQIPVERFSRMVPLSEIQGNDFNLNIPRYIDSTEPEDLQDIEAHLRGGIPVRDIDDLRKYWDVFPGVRGALFAAADRPWYLKVKVEADKIKQVIFEHPEFKKFQDSVNKVFAGWKKESEPLLGGISKRTLPKELIENLSEKLLSAFQKTALVDPYDVYQHLMTYWAETLQDDVYMIVDAGWKDAAKPRQIVDEAGKKSKEKPDFTAGKLKFKAELIPVPLMIERYFKDQQTKIETLESEASGFEQQLEELKEEHGSEDGLLSEVMEDGKISKGAVAVRLKAIAKDKDAGEERKILEEYQTLVEKGAESNRKVKEAGQELEALVAARYSKLTEDEVKILVIQDKWISALDAMIHGEMDRVTQALTGRIKELTERYATPLAELNAQVSAMEAKVQGHLAKMGFAQ